MAVAHSTVVRTHTGVLKRQPQADLTSVTSI